MSSERCRAVAVADPDNWDAAVMEPHTEGHWVHFKEYERLQGLIRDHNVGCAAACQAMPREHCQPYKSRGRRCPDCPQDDMIDVTAGSAGGSKK